MCVLYKNNPVLNKLIENLFNSQQKFYHDFKQCIKDIVKAIETSKTKLRDMFELNNEYLNSNNNNRSLSSGNNQNLDEKLHKRFKEIFEVIYYLIDFFKTLNNVIKVHPKLTEYLFDTKFEKK